MTSLPLRRITAANERTLPPPGEPEMGKVAAAARDHGVELLGPPPRRNGLSAPAERRRAHDKLGSSERPRHDRRHVPNGNQQRMIVPIGRSAAVSLLR